MPTRPSEKPLLYPTAKELHLLSLQEIVRRGLIDLAPASHGTVDPR